MSRVFSVLHHNQCMISTFPCKRVLSDWCFAFLSCSPLPVLDGATQQCSSSKQQPSGGTLGKPGLAMMIFSCKISLKFPCFVFVSWNSQMVIIIMYFAELAKADIQAHRDSNEVLFHCLCPHIQNFIHSSV